MEVEDRLLTLYNEVFNSDGTVKLCGRGKCIELILECKRIDADRYYGNTETGIMCIDNIKKLIAEYEVNDYPIYTTI